MITDNDRRTLIRALDLARERVTGDDVRWKRERREHIASLATHVSLSGELSPPASELRDALGHLDDRELLRILDEWDEEPPA